MQTLEQIICRLCNKVIWANAVPNEDHDCFYHEKCNDELLADRLSKQTPFDVVGTQMDVITRGL